MKKSLIRSKILSLILVFIFLFTACGRSTIINKNTTPTEESTQSNSEDNNSATNTSAIAEQEKFDTYMNDIYANEIVKNTINLHFNLAYPEKAGINDYDVSLGDCSESTFNKVITDSQNYLDKLNKFDYKLLTDEQQLVFDLMEDAFEGSLDYDGYYLYQEFLSPNSGMTSTFPTLLTEINFYDEEDIDDYFEILKLIPDYFKSIINFEKEKSDNGLFMADFEIEQLIDQCNEFLTFSANDHFLTESFNTRIDSMNIKDKEKINEYKSKNLELIKNYILPAYQYIIDEVTKLKGTGKNNTGLAGFDKGKEYYELLVRDLTGSDVSINKIKEKINKKYNADIFELLSLNKSDSSILDKIDKCNVDVDDETSVLTSLKNDIKKDFPNGPSTSFTVKSVAKSMEKYENPAYFLIPAQDNYMNNVIYINEANNLEGLTKFSTLAHEGYPGHLYQTTYFDSINNYPVRSLLSFPGYTEGWGTYAEIYSYSLAGLDDSAVRINEINTSTILAFYCLIDIGINYEGWTLDDTIDYVTDYGYDEEVATQVFEYLVADPGVYLSYYFGYLQICELRDKAEASLGDEFSLKKFHEYILNLGPAPYYIIDEYINEWIDEQTEYIAS